VHTIEYYRRVKTVTVLLTGKRVPTMHGSRPSTLKACMQMSGYRTLFSPFNMSSA